MDTQSIITELKGYKIYHSDQDISDMVKYVRGGNEITLRKGQITVKISEDNLVHLVTFLKDNFCFPFFM